jgi:hypothetical protein
MLRQGSQDFCSSMHHKRAGTVGFNLAMALISTGLEKGQEKSQRRKDERTTVLNPTSCGHPIG